MKLPRIKEDGRLLVIEICIDDKMQECALTNEGGYIPLDEVRKYFSVDRLSKVKDEDLIVPESMIVGYLPDIPDINKVDEEGKSYFLDKNYIFPKKGFSSLRNTKIDLLTGKKVGYEAGYRDDFAHLLRERAVDEVSHASKVHSPVVIFPGGVAGGGKGTIVVDRAKEKFEEEGFFLAERDGMRERFFSYHIDIHKLVGAHGFDYRDIHNAITYYNEQAIYEACRLMRAEGKSPNIIKDGSLSNFDDNIPLLKSLSDSGYRTKLHLVLAPIEKSKKRNIRRFKKEGRIVPGEVLENIAISVIEHMVDYMASPYAHDILITDNSGSKGEDEIIARCVYINQQEYDRLWEYKEYPFIFIGDKIINGDNLLKILEIYDCDKLRNSFVDAIEHGAEVPDEVKEFNGKYYKLDNSFSSFDLSVQLYNLLKYN